MEIKNELIEKLEVLSKIKLSDEENLKTQKDIEKIVAFMDTLKELDTENEEALSHAFNIKNVMREDEVEPSLDRLDVLKNAPSSDGVCFKVPKTF